MKAKLLNRELRLLLILITCMISGLLASCEDDDKADIVITGNVSEVGSLFAIISGSINIDAIPNPYSSIEIGVEVSAKMDFTDKSRHIISEVIGKTFTVRCCPLRPNTTYYYRTYVSISSNSFDYYGKTSTFTTKEITSTDRCVDLGLPSGTLWATMNVGASKPEECGDYFAWGETTPKETYDVKNYKYGEYHNLKKYCTKEEYGYVDNKTELDSEDDAAYMNWGREWQMPSNEQRTELITICTWTKTQLNGVVGAKVTGPNGNSIFLPAAGYLIPDGSYAKNMMGFYWTRTLNIDYPNMAIMMEFSNNPSQYEYLSLRGDGLQVRPVCSPK